MGSLISLSLSLGCLTTQNDERLRTSGRQLCSQHGEVPTLKLATRLAVKSQVTGEDLMYVRAVFVTHTLNLVSGRLVPCERSDIRLRVSNS